MGPAEAVWWFLHMRVAAQDVLCQAGATTTSGLSGFWRPPPGIIGRPKVPVFQGLVRRVDLGFRQSLNDSFVSGSGPLAVRMAGGGDD